MTQTSAMIRLHGIEKRFGTFRAVAGVDLDIQRGEFFSILGASGSGKTTLLRILAGFESATEGSLEIDGQPMDAIPPHLRPVNMVFQNYAIFPHLNVGDNIAFGLRRLKLGAAERARRIDEMLELIKLPGFGSRRADQLSGGQRQRVALARALILRPKVLLLDEPLGALDKQLREQMQVELRSLQRSVGITFVLVTHDQEEALTLSDRIAVMADGKVLQVDTPDGLYERPLSRRVASFVGTMNFLPARLSGHVNGHLDVEIAGLGPCSIPSEGLPPQGPGDLSVAIRPERFAILSDPAEGAGRMVEGVVADRVYLGERSHFHIRLPGCDRPVAVSAANRAGAGGPAGPEPGQKVWLTWEDAALIPLTAD